jgi:hypothetical protein
MAPPPAASPPSAPFCFMAASSSHGRRLCSASSHGRPLPLLQMASSTSAWSRALPSPPAGSPSSFPLLSHGRARASHGALPPSLCCTWRQAATALSLAAPKVDDQPPLPCSCRGRATTSPAVALSPSIVSAPETNPWPPSTRVLGLPSAASTDPRSSAGPQQGAPSSLSSVVPAGCSTKCAASRAMQQAICDVVKTLGEKPPLFSMFIFRCV